MITIWEPGITSLASFDTLFILPIRSPLFSQLLDFVYALICELQASGLLDRRFILKPGFIWLIVAIEAWARLPPPAIVT